MVDNLEHQLCRLVVGNICKQLQWDSVKLSTLEVLSEILERFIVKVGSMAVEIAENGNRQNIQKIVV